MTPRPATLPLLLSDLLRIEPLASAEVVGLPDPPRGIEQVILAETFERLRHAAPHSLVVLHAEVATGGWSLAAALHLAWERNVSAVVVARTVAGPSSAVLARRLKVPLLLIDGDPVDIALRLAGQVSAPDASRALRQALCAERLAEQTSIRGVLGVLNSELGTIPVALVIGDSVAAGRAAAVQKRPDVRQVCIDISGPGERTWARLVAAVPTNMPAAMQQTATLLRLARPSLLASWAQTRLDSSAHAALEQATFGLLRRLATESAPPAPLTEDTAMDVPPWISELGWHIDGVNRAVWLTPLRPHGESPQELTHLVRTAWQRGRPAWPLIAEGEGWISWHSGTDADDVTPLRRALSAFRDVASAHQLVVGVGLAHQGIPGLMRSIAEARLAAHVAKDAGAATVQWFDQVGPRAALAWLPMADIEQVAQLCLAELMAARDRVALVDTVLAVLDCGGSLSQASQRLGVHRNTVLARVMRARQLGLTFDEPTQRLALHVLCYVLASLWKTQPTAAQPTASL
jgi:hypothetical protein